LHRAGLGDLARVGVENQAEAVGTLVVGGDFGIDLFGVIRTASTFILTGHLFNFLVGALTVLQSSCRGTFFSKLLNLVGTLMFTSTCGNQKNGKIVIVTNLC
jgi:hypothetical protein